MGKTYNPTSFVAELTPHHTRWVQSVHKALNAGINFGTGSATNPATGGVNAGVYTQFEKGNGDGELVRIAGAGVGGTGALYEWPSSGSLVINHTLGRKPVGFHLVDSDKDVRIFRTASPTITQISLQPTDSSASVTLYIF